MPSVSPLVHGSQPFKCGRPTVLYQMKYPTHQLRKEG